MSMGINLLQAQASEWALVRRHKSEDTYGIQVAGSIPEKMAQVAKLLDNETSSDFVDLNCGCPIDLLCNQGCGAAMMNKPNKLVACVGQLGKHLNRSVTCKIRVGWDEKNPNAHKIIPQLQKLQCVEKIAAVFIHGRSRLQRYSKLADWDYVLTAAKFQDPTLPILPVIGNGDIMSWQDWKDHQDLVDNHETKDIDTQDIKLTSCAMVGRGALIKPWLPSEIKEKRHIDLSATERLDIIRKYCDYGLEHWGSDQQVGGGVFFLF